MRSRNLRVFRLLLMAVFLICLLAAPSLAGAAMSRTYTLDADFDEGTLTGVEHETVHDQLQLSRTNVTFPFIWVPNSDGTVSKVSTEPPYNELGRYRVVPPNVSANQGSPSRTTVDLEGSCWVGNREAGTVVKIGLLEAGKWIDRNGNGVCDTSRDLNGDGVISGSEVLPWGQDECVLYEVVLIDGKQGTYAPGTYTGGYDTNYWGTSPRGLAVDRNNNLWAGTWSSHKFYYIDGATGQILKVVDVSPYSSYGAVIDKNGVLWSSSASGNYVLRIDPRTEPVSVTKIDLGHYSYGLGLDYQNHLFVSGWTDRKLTRINIDTGAKEWTSPYRSELNGSRGVLCTPDNNIWVANSSANTVTRYDNNGNLLATITGFNQPTGLSIDADGKIWVCGIGTSRIFRVDPGTNSIIGWKDISGTHYSYSDMTGAIVRSITTKTGTWEVVCDGGAADTLWDRISWTSSEPSGTSITICAMTSNDGVNWSTPVDAANGVSLPDSVQGRYLKVITTFKIMSGEESPILYDLTVFTKDLLPPPPVWYIYMAKQKDTGNDWICDANFANKVQLPTNTASTVITRTDTDGDGKYDRAEVTVRNAFPGYYNSIVLDVLNTGTVPIRMDQVKIGADGALQVRLLESLSSTIQPGYRKAIGIDFRVADGAAPGDYSFTVSL